MRVCKNKSAGFTLNSELSRVAMSHKVSGKQRSAKAVPRAKKEESWHISLLIVSYL